MKNHRAAELFFCGSMRFREDGLTPLVRVRALPPCVFRIDERLRMTESTDGFFRSICFTPGELVIDSFTTPDLRSATLREGREGAPLRGRCDTADVA